MKQITLLSLSLMTYFWGFSQVGIGTVTPNPSSLLDVESTAAGVLIPRMTQAERDAISAPAESLLVYQTDSGAGFYYFNGTGWVPFGGGGEFISVSGVVQNTTDLVNDDFVFGSPVLGDSNTLLGLYDARFLFYKGKGAFRAGLVEDTQWDNGAVGDYSAAFGFNTIASGSSSFTAGEESSTSGDSAAAFGLASTATGDAAFAAGEAASASGDAAIAMGFQVDASGNSAIALGDGSIASGNIAIAIGENAEANAGTAVAIGSGGLASSANSVAIGRDATASGSDSIAIGRDALASGSHSLALGRDAIASGAQSIGMGSFSNASGSQSITLGFTTTATATNAIALGAFTVASGANAMATGLNTTTPSFAETVVGMYNTAYVPVSNIIYQGADRIFSIGNGQSTALRSNAMTVLKNGNIGIGSDVPTAAKLVVSGSQNATIAANYGFLDSSGLTGSGSGAQDYSIVASHNIAAQQFSAYSDKRIKTVLGKSNSNEDLETLSKIEVTNYKLKDTIARGHQLYKKVIAQQVKAVYPIAVTANFSEIIPNIYELSEIKNGWIVSHSNQVKKGDEVKLIFKDTEEILTVENVLNGKFEVHSPRQEKVFVYGTRVNDFHTVDYEAISMLNVSATQALLKRIEELESRLASQESRLTTIEASLGKTILLNAKQLTKN